MFKLLKIVLQRLGLGLFVLFVISVIIAGAVELLPGDLCQEIQGQAVCLLTNMLSATRVIVLISWLRFP